MKIVGYKNPEPVPTSGTQLNALLTGFKKKKITIPALLISTLLVGGTVSAKQTAELETVAQFHDLRPAGVAVTEEGRIFVSMHPLDTPTYRVMEIMANGSKQPFPNADWADGPEIGNVGLASVLGIHTDSKGVIWMLDMGNEEAPTQLVGWNTQNNTLEKVIKIPKTALVNNSFPQDFVIDEKRQKVYIADMSFGNFAGATQPGMIIVDMNSGVSRRVIQGLSKFISPDRDITIEGSLLASRGDQGETNKLRFGLNPIAIDEHFDWVYFATMNGEVIYRLPAASLSDASQSDSNIEDKIEVFGPKRPSDGMLYVAGKGITVTDLENNAVGLSANGKYTVLVQDQVLSWPDSMAYSNGYIYVTSDQLHKHPAFSQDKGVAKPPYKLMRFKLN